MREEMSSIFKSDRFSFEKHLQLLDGRNMQVGRGTGTKIGTAADQKLGFFGVTPVIQFGDAIGRQDFSGSGGSSATTATTFNGNTGTKYYTVGDLVYALKQYGFLDIS